MAALSSIGVQPWYAGPAAVASAVLGPGLLALAWMIAAAGIGALMSPLWNGAGLGWWRDLSLRVACGVAAMLWVSHLMGVMGVMNFLTAWGVVLAGAAVVGWTAWRPRPVSDREQKMSLPPAPFLAGRGVVLAALLAVLAVAASCPPGTLWVSEARGFDVLSYHLQLPREWLAQGRLWPLEHNAYSWLPSYVEAAYMHLGAMIPGNNPFIDGDGTATLASNMLHALMACAAAGCVAGLAQRAAAGLVMLGVPWVIVTGSLSYNEMAVCLMLAASLIVVTVEGIPAGRRGALAGLLVGAACAAKPTALFMVGAPVGIVMLARLPAREWRRAALAGAIAGIVVLGPYLLRNWAAGGNPVFPYMSSIFGAGHWSALEVARWHAGHHESAGVPARLGLLVSARGFGHLQWGILPVVGVVAGIAVIALRRFREERGAAIVMVVVALVQVVMWLVIGHLQSRFLLPVVVPLCVLVSMVPALAWGTAAVHVVLSAALLFTSGAARPGVLAALGVRFMVEGGPPPVGAEERREWEESLSPAQWVNAQPRGSMPRLFLLGDSTPLYFREAVRYHTTWDASPLGVLLREESGDLESAAARLGATHVLVNFDELARLRRDGWYDPHVSPETAARLAALGRVVRRWEVPGGAGSVLVEMPFPAPR